jgi:acyl dehydratase
MDTMRIFESLTELQSAVGEELGASDWLLIDQARIDLFAEATGDHQWIHTDPVRAQAGPFGTTIAHGYLTLSLVAKFTEETFEVRGIQGAINYGLNKVRFPSPVPVNARVRAVTRLVSYEEIAGGGQILLSIVVETEGGSKPACVAESIVRFFA